MIHHNTSQNHPESLEQTIDNTFINTITLAEVITLAGVAGTLLNLLGGVGPDWATRIGGPIFAAVMLGAVAVVHGQNGWNSINMGEGNEGKGMEFQVLILAISLFFAFKGNSANAAVESD